MIQESSPPRYSIHTLPPPTTPIEVNLNTNAACKHDVFTRLAVVMPTGWSGDGHVCRTVCYFTSHYVYHSHAAHVYHVSTPFLHHYTPSSSGSIMVFLLLANITTGAGQVRQGDVGATVVFVILAACTCLLLSLSVCALCVLHTKCTTIDQQ